MYYDMEDDILQRDSNAHSFFVLRILKRDTRWQPCVSSGEFVLGNWIYVYLFHPFPGNELLNSTHHSMIYLNSALLILLSEGRALPS